MVVMVMPYVRLTTQYNQFVCNTRTLVMWMASTLVCTSLQQTCTVAAWSSGVSKVRRRGTREGRGGEGGRKGVEGGEEDRQVKVGGEVRRMRGRGGQRREGEGRGGKGREGARFTN